METSAQMLFPWTPVMFLCCSEWENNVEFLTSTKDLKVQLAFLTDKQAAWGVGWVEQGCRGLGVEDLDSCTRSVMERLGLPARQRLLLKAEVPQGDILMHDGWNKIKQNGINPSYSSYWWSGGASCSPLATFNLRLALPSIIHVLLYGTPTGALRENGLF